MHQVDGQQPAVAVHQVRARQGRGGRRAVAPAGAGEHGRPDRAEGQGGEGGGEQHQHEEDAVGGVFLAPLGLGVLEGVLDAPDAGLEPAPQGGSLTDREVDRTHWATA